MAIHRFPAEKWLKSSSSLSLPLLPFCHFASIWLQWFLSESSFPHPLRGYQLRKNGYAFLYPRHLCRGVYSFRLDVCPFVRSYVRSLVRSFVRVFVRSLLSVTFVEFTSKFLVKVSLSEYISLTTHQKAFIFEPWVPERVSFYTMSFCPRVDAPGWG